MANKLALNFICKNESHVLPEMLESAKGITDLIVASDTGSTDDSIAIIRGFGRANGIPTYVFERPFDNFGQSRNFALQKLRETVNTLGWDPKEVWGYWFDCDEVLFVNERFDKASLKEDFYVVEGFAYDVRFLRGSLFNLGRNFEWYGPIHEKLVVKKEKLKATFLSGLSFKCENKGHSWQGDIAKKYLNYVDGLKDMLNTEYADRWLFYIGESYKIAAQHTDDADTKTQLYQQAINYFLEVIRLNTPNSEFVFYSHFQLAWIAKASGHRWAEVWCGFMDAFSVDTQRGEPIKAIITGFMDSEQWAMAYIFSGYAMRHYAGKSPYPRKSLLVDEKFYAWQVLDMHSMICYHLGKTDETLQTFRELLKVSKAHPEFFTEGELQGIKAKEESIAHVEYVA